MGLTALASCAAERLAEQRVALDAVQAEESLPSWPPLSPLLPQPRPRPMLHIYWPADARAPGTVYGWSTHEVVVVACVHPDTEPRAWTHMPRVRCFGIGVHVHAYDATFMYVMAVDRRAGDERMASRRVASIAKRCSRRV